jgi:hypothetical protein
MYDKSSNKKSSDSALVVNIKIDPTINILKSMKSKDKSNCFILDSDGNIVGSPESKDLFNNIYNEKYISKILSNTSGSGSFTYEKDGNLLFMSYLYSPVLQWTFVNTTPYGLAYSKVEGMKHTTLMINIMILLLAI